MAVAYKQLKELLQVIMKHVPQEQVRPLLRDLMKTEAFERNKSFANTITRLYQEANG